jgi:hypothetical protein
MPADAQPSHFDWQSEDGHDAIREIANAVRAADRDFESSGGSSRHWVRDHFIPELESNGFTIVRKDVAS